MKDDQSFPEWADDLNELLDAYFADPKNWHAARSRAGREQDYNPRALPLAKGCAAERMALYAAGHRAKKLFHPDFDNTRFFGPGAVGLLDTLGWWACGAAEHAAPSMVRKWGRSIPTGLRRSRAERRQLAVAQALATQRSGESIEDILRRAGVSRAQGYRILNSKGRSLD